MKGEAVAVAQSAGPVALPGLPTVGAAQHGAGLDAHDDDSGVRGRERDGSRAGGAPEENEQASALCSSLRGTVSLAPCRNGWPRSLRHVQEFLETAHDFA